MEILRSLLGPRLQWEEVYVRGNGVNHLARAAREVIRAARRGRPAVLHAHGTRAAIPAAVARRITGTPMVVTVHGLHPIRRAATDRRRFLAALMIRPIYRQADAVVALGYSDAKGIAANRLAPSERVHVLPPLFVRPRDVARKEAREALGLSRKAVVPLWIGRLETVKDPLTFVRAFLEISEPRVKGLMVGAGPLQSPVEKLVDRLNLGDRIVLAGWMADAAEAYAAADMLVNTSLWEGASMSLYEAASVGLPLVVSDAPGNRDLAEQGMLGGRFPVRDASALANILRTLAEDRERRRRLGGEARRAAREHSSERTAGRILELYEAVSSSARR